MAILHPRQYEFIFALERQADIETGIDVAMLNKQRSIRTFAPAMEDQPAVISDMEWYGKGHPHATFRDVIQKMYTLPAQDRSATSLEALYALAYVMGNVVSTVPNTALPDEHRHVITWQDQSINKQVLYTSMLEKMGNEYHKRITGAWINEVTLTGDRADHVVMSFTGGAGRYVTVPISGAGSIPSPGISPAAFFKTLYGRVRLGAASVPPIPDISAQVLSWNITVMQNATPYFLMGNAPGDESLVSLTVIGDQTVSGSVVIFVDEDQRNFYLDQDTIQIDLVCRSPDLTGPGGSQHEMVLSLPTLKFSTEAFGEDEETTTYTMTFDEQSVLKGNTTEHFQATFLSDIDTSELLVVSP